MGRACARAGAATSHRGRNPLPRAGDGGHGDVCHDQCVLRSLLAPLTAGSTYRRFVHLLLGAVLVLPYAALTGLFVLSVRLGGLEPMVLVPLVVVAVIVGVGVAFVPGVRALEIAAARALLGAQVPDPEPATVDSWPARRRAVAWLLVNLVAGGFVALSTLMVVPWAIGFLLAPWLAFGGFPTGMAAAWAPPVGVILPMLLLHVVAGVGAGLARLAPRLLGPSTAERLATDLAQARRTEQASAQRTRLARELHDSVGHALTVTTLQAGAAARVLETDPAFVARALEAIADAGRNALADLDHVLGLLRDADGAERAPQPDLADLDALLTGARSAGVGVATAIDGDLGAVPGVVSREAYRIVQEALTNSLRHAGPVPVSVRVDVAAAALELEISNDVGDTSPSPKGGRGIAGMRERVSVLHGELAAGPESGKWRVLARIPLREMMTG